MQTFLKVSEIDTHTIHYLHTLYQLRNKLNGENSEIIVFNEDAPNPYIVSENEDYIFIDYITGVKNSKTSVVYYRIIIQNTKDLNVEISDDEYIEWKLNFEIENKIM